MKTIFSLFLVIIFAGCTSVTSDKDPIPSVNYETLLSESGIELPEVSTPVANYTNVVQSGNLLFLSGKGPRLNDGSYIQGKVGSELTQEQGYEAAKVVAYNQIAVLNDYLGDLNRVKRIVKVLGMVNATDEFTNHPEVINGFSDVMVSVFGEKGKHARSAVGMSSLPRNIAVEIEVIVEIY